MNPRVTYGKPNFSAINAADGYAADLHVHTNHSHDCSVPVSDVLRRAQILGFKVAITDHNNIGGVREAHQTPLGRELVIPGVEITTKENKDVLAWFYKLDDLERFFARNVAPRMKKRNRLRTNKTSYPMRELLADLARERCVIGLPHPIGAVTKSSYGYFRRKKNAYLLDYVHAIEVINNSVAHKSNLAALGWSIQLQKGATAGSDAHILRHVGAAVTVVADASSHAEFLDALRSGETTVYGKHIKLSGRIAKGLRLIAEKTKPIKRKPGASRKAHKAHKARKPRKVRLLKKKR